MITDAANANQFAADIAVEELVRLGVTAFFVSPGSRSTPLVAAAARHPRADVHVHFDERGSAFAALGYARATLSPAVWLTTSGTAVANGMPAIVEAATDAVPLIAITADRPPELRKTDSNQTIDQPGIFGNHTCWFFDLPPWDPNLDPTFLLTTVDQAVFRAEADAGPVHLNWMFREPLAPTADRSFEPPVGLPIGRWLDSGAPYTSYLKSLPGMPDGLADEIAAVAAGSGLVVAGRLRSRAEGKAVADLAEHLGWPLFADILSFARGSEASTAISNFDLLLALDEFRDRLQPRTVLHFGGRATSKRLYEHLEHNPPERFVLVSSVRDRVDPIHRVTQRIESDVREVAEALRSQLSSKAIGAARPPTDVVLQRRYQTHVDQTLSDALSSASELTEPWVARHVARSLGPGQGLFVGSSMPIRDVDSFAGSSGPLAAYGNRGASGIDGTVASAVGVAVGRRSAMTVFLGDLALLHDLNSLALVRSCPYPVIVVVANNDGGGIFSFLPIADYPDVFEPYFGTPHGLSFESAAEMFGLTYAAPSDADAFSSTYDALVRAGTPGLIEVRTSRERNFEVHRELLDEIRAAAQEAVRPDRVTQA